jgi:sodium-dependent dicarboxylate transporter 2/3/5
VDAEARALGRLSDGERRYESIRRRVGLLGAPLVFLTLLALPMPALEPRAHRLAAVMATVIVLWITEAVPLPVTALLGVAACVFLQVAPAKDAFAPLADPLMLLFIGSFILARAIFLHGLDRRLAFAVLSLRWVGARPGRILFAFGAVTAGISAWISNTAATAMMYAIGMSILAFLDKRPGPAGGGLDHRYATGLMLMTSFAASVGGLATPIGTPPNLIGLGFIREQLGVQLPFLTWMLLGVPVVVTLFLFLWAYLNFFCAAGLPAIDGGGALLERQRAALGPWTTAQRSTLAAFLVTVGLWILPGIAALGVGEDSEAYRFINRSLPEAVAAVFGAGLLFLLPGNGGRRALTWDEAVQIDWGVVLLYGGGFALGVMSSQTGLAAAVGHGLTGWLPAGSGSFGLLVAATVVAALVSETTSNTASANIVVPVVIAVARATGIDPLEPALGATFGASLGFMLPVSTPCNAIVYGSGHVPLGRMIRYGALLDVVGVAVIVVLVRLLGPWLR